MYEASSLAGQSLSQRALQGSRQVQRDGEAAKGARELARIILEGIKGVPRNGGRK